MNKQKKATKVISLLLSLTLLPACSYYYGVEESPALKVEAKASPAATAEAIQSKLQKIMDEAIASPKTSFNGAVIRIETKDHVWSLASGIGDIATGTPMRAHDRFRSGSLVKPFISTVMMQLGEAGHFSLDTKITEVLPTKYTDGFKYASDITLEMLLNHTSGIGEWSDDEMDMIALGDLSRVWSADEFIARAAAKGPEFKPGEKYSYNNTEYTLLGLVIEEVTGKSWRQNIRERIFEPLELKNTSLPEPGTRTIVGDHAHGYVTFDGKTHDVTNLDPSMADAAGGHALVTNTEDLALFLNALLDGKFFTHSATLKMMQRFVDTNTPQTPDVGYGLGLEQQEFFEDVISIGHMGSTGGYAAIVFEIPEYGMTVSSMLNDTDLHNLVTYMYAAIKLVIDETS